MFNRENSEGKTVRTYYEVPLSLPKIDIMALTWTLVHKIDEESPFWNKKKEDIIKQQPEFLILVNGFDEIYPENSMVGDSPLERAQVRTISRIADIYLMNNIFMSLSQLMTKTPNQGVLDLLLGQVDRGIGALEQQIGSGDYAVGDKLTRADCTLVPALWMCQGTVPRLGGENPIPGAEKVTAYWEKIQKNEYADKIIEEMKRGMKARLDGTEAKMRAAAIEKAGKG